MQRALEASVRVESAPESVIGILVRDPAGVLTGMPSSETETFPAEITVDLGGGTSLSHGVDMTFCRLPSEGPVGRFRLSWHAQDHQGALPMFEGDLEVHPDVEGSRLHLVGHYTVPLGPVGAFGDRVLGHRIARHSVQAFLEAAGARVVSGVTRESADGPFAGYSPENIAVTPEDLHTDLYLG